MAEIERQIYFSKIKYKHAVVTFTNTVNGYKNTDTETVSLKIH